jgi:hypothetical protein
MHNQEVHSKILDSFKLNMTISDWRVGGSVCTTSSVVEGISYDVITVTDINHPNNQYTTLTN